MSRFRVGCAGMFALGMDYPANDRDEAIVSCEAGPAGCEVYDTVEKKWIGPTCWEDINEAKARLAARVTAKAESALTVTQADEHERCVGCRVSYERGVRYVKGVPGCPVHSGVKP